MYAVYENFTDALIPDGFTRSTITYNGEEHSAVVQDNSENPLFSLVTGENDPIMALYDEKNSKFVAAEQVIMGDEFYLLILGEGDGKFSPGTVCGDDSGIKRNDLPGMAEYGSNGLLPS